MDTIPSFCRIIRSFGVDTGTIITVTAIVMIVIVHLVLVIVVVIVAIVVIELDLSFVLHFKHGVSTSEDGTQDKEHQHKYQHYIPIYYDQSTLQRLLHAVCI